jgi:hypothetical protein
VTLRVILSYDVLGLVRQCSIFVSKCDFFLHCLILSMGFSPGMPCWCLCVAGLLSVNSVLVCVVGVSCLSLSLSLVLQTHSSLMEARTALNQQAQQTHQ